MSVAGVEPPPPALVLKSGCGWSGRRLQLPALPCLSWYKKCKGVAGGFAMFCGSCCRTFVDAVVLDGDAPAPAAIEAPEVCGHLTKSAFEQFGESFNVRSLPIVLFNDDASQQLVWHRGRIQGGVVRCPEGEPDVRARDAVVMSPAYLGFAIEPYEQRYLHYKGVGIMFARPYRGKFMQPSIDTILVCHALDKLFQGKGCSFSRAIDIGTGSGFIGKFVGVKAPGDGRLEVSLVDVDSLAEEYCMSNGFGACSRSASGREVDWSFRTADACALLQEDSDFDLLVSNPPYIPTQEEAENDGSVAPSNFWEGCGLLAFLLELMLHRRCRDGAHLVVMVTSLTLKAKRVRSLLEEAARKGLHIEVLLEREIAWKAWYAGAGRGSKYLMAEGEEIGTRQRIGQHEYFVGAMPPGRSRIKGQRDQLYGYHWHYAYVLDISAIGMSHAVQLAL